MRDLYQGLRALNVADERIRFEAFGSQQSLEHASMASRAPELTSGGWERDVPPVGPHDRLGGTGQRSATGRVEWDSCTFVVPRGYLGRRRCARAGAQRGLCRRDCRRAGTRLRVTLHCEAGRSGQGGQGSVVIDLQSRLSEGHCGLASCASLLKAWPYLLGGVKTLLLSPIPAFLCSQHRYREAHSGQAISRFLRRVASGHPP